MAPDIGGHAFVTFSSSVNDMLFLPFAGVVLLMSQHMADVNLVPIIVYRGDQSNFVAAYIKDRELFHLIGLRENLA